MGATEPVSIDRALDFDELDYTLEPGLIANRHQNKNTAESGAESPTTARPLEMDDDDIQDTGVLGGDNAATTTATTTTTTTTTGQPDTTASTTAPVGTTKPPAPTVEDEDAPPAKPPRPLTEAQKNQAILKEAFPSVDGNVIKAVLSASKGQVEPAFNALLGMDGTGKLMSARKSRG